MARRIPVGEVQLLTGQNGTGKTRLLCLLVAACGNPGPLNARMAWRAIQTAASLASTSPGEEYGCGRRKLVRWEAEPMLPKTLLRFLETGQQFVDSRPIYRRYQASWKRRAPCGCICLSRDGESR